MNETEKMINEIIKQSKNEKWDFIKTNATINEFDNKLKELYLDVIVERFFINNPSENIINEIIKWANTQYDINENPIYTQDFNIAELIKPIPEIKPKYWLIFFKHR